MQFTFATLALVAATAVSAQGVSSNISPAAPAPSGCQTTFPQFEIQVVKPSTKRSIDVLKRASACSSSGNLVAQIKGGVLTDSQGRIGSIVANRQFQFDGPPAQTGAIYTAGWSVCGNGSLALGGSTVFYQCGSGRPDGSIFYNLYDQNVAAQCSQVVIEVFPCGSASTTGGVSQICDGQIQATSAGPKVSQISDGQIQATSAAKVSQISDGQIQATSAAGKVSQISDGQIQATSAAKVSQISDGQIQATSAAGKVSQISDGQIQATSAAPKVSQICDGQIQAPTAPISQYTDGQLQVTVMPTGVATSMRVTQISDGQIQAPTAIPTLSTTRAANATRPTAVPAAAGANGVAVSFFGGVLAIAGLLVL